MASFKDMAEAAKRESQARAKEASIKRAEERAKAQAQFGADASVLKNRIHPVLQEMSEAAEAIGFSARIFDNFGRPVESASKNEAILSFAFSGRAYRRPFGNRFLVTPSSETLSIKCLKGRLTMHASKSTPTLLEGDPREQMEVVFKNMVETYLARNK